eukprot:TRINITY_DN8148_c0_g1_i1.p1 TRINITY_DN8148_c0_g1~~TRINITY_DN8148_c0_g1_i1.p1  ORF type:complete len:1023 (-),score=218.11 TRINITY_DN8148_c0_g1_i1:3059-6127(-)
MSLFDQTALLAENEEAIASQAPPAPTVIPMFSIERVQYDPKNLVEMSVNNNMIVIAQNNTHVIRINLKNDELEDIDIARRPDDLIYRIFQDPTGHHVIVAMAGEEAVYLHSSDKRGRTLLKWKGLPIESIAWDTYNKDINNPGTLLVGTTNGKVFQATVDDKKYPNLLWNAPTLVVDGKEMLNSITGLHWERIGDTQMLFAIATTNIKLFQFVGSNTIEGLFTQECESSSVELTGKRNYKGKFSFASSRFLGPTSRFAWTSGGGLYHGRFNLLGGINVGEPVIVDGKLFPYDNVVNLQSAIAANQQMAPLAISLVITEFHAIVLFERSIQAVNLITSEVDYNFVFNERVGVVRCIARDGNGSSIFVCTESNVFEIVVKDEDRDVWKIYASRKEWELAVKYCKEDKKKENEVLLLQAEHFLSEGKFEYAAKIFGKTNASFEDISLRLIGSGKSDALIVFISNRVENIDPKFATQMTCICAWLVELFLHRTVRLRDEIQSQGQRELLGSYKTEFRDFLRLFRGSLHKRTIFNLIASYGEIDDLVYYCQLSGDFSFPIAHFIRIGEPRKAIELLSTLGPENEDLFYIFSPMLIPRVPSLTVDLWTKARFLQPKKLFPALMRYSVKVSQLLQQQRVRGAANVAGGQQRTNVLADLPVLSEEQIKSLPALEQYKYIQESLKRKQAGPMAVKSDISDEYLQVDAELKQNQAVRYLRFCVAQLNNREVAVHNYLISIFAQLDDDESLFFFINSPESNCDLKYALRLCTKLGKKLACIHIYTKMGLHEEAVDLALKMNRLDLATMNADKPEDYQIKKKLWLKIAQHVVQDKRDVQSVMNFFKQCRVLRIEDILPFFPDTALIREFKAEILEGLRGYNKDIESLRDRMARSENTSRRVKEDVFSLKLKFGVLSCGHPCSVCRSPAEIRPFFFFPCRHAVHEDCLVRRAAAFLRAALARRVAEISRQITLLNETADEGSVAAQNKLGSLRAELEELVGGECPFCGDAMVSLSSRPFIDSLDDNISILTTPTV